MMNWLLSEVAPVPTMTLPFVSTPLLTNSRLLFAAPLPMVTLPPPRFQNAPPPVMATVLLLAAEPMTLAPLLQTLLPLVMRRLLP